ncbi:unnamed protein product, partial [Staurois parvus]
MKKVPGASRALGRCPGFQMVSPPLIHTHILKDSFHFYISLLFHIFMSIVHIKNCHSNGYLCIMQ